MSIAQINNQGIYYEDSGGDKPAIIFMHGFLMDHTMFDGQVEALAGNYRCVRWDARGFGQTEWDGQPFSLYDSAADCVGLMDHLGIEQAVIAGMSQGGYCALRVALQYPERVKALVLIDTRSGVDEDEVKAGYREMRDTWSQVGPVDPLVEGLMTAIIGPKDDPAIAEYWQVWTPKWKAISGDHIVGAMNNLLERDEITPRLGEIKVPALIIHGEEDHGIPIQLGEALDKALPNSKGLVRVPGAAHASSMTHAHVVNPPLLQFLEQYA